MLEFETLTLSGRPNAWLVAPDGFCLKATPHASAPRLPTTPEAAFAAWLRTLEREPRTFVARQDPARLQVDSIHRTAILRFADDVTARFLPDGAGGAWPAIYSRSRIGHYDFQTNRRRVERLLGRMIEMLHAREGEGD